MRKLLLTRFTTAFIMLVSCWLGNKRLAVAQAPCPNYPAVQYCNLIRNGSFEDFTTCPTIEGEFGRPQYGILSKVCEWYNPTYYSTPDYFNTCTTNQQFDVPSNLTNCSYSGGTAALGNNGPTSVGNAYGGIIVFDDRGVEREYIATPVDIKLGASYYGEFYAKAGENSAFVVKELGLSVLPDNTIYNPSSGLLPYSPVIKNAQPLPTNQGASWTLIKGAFKATANGRSIAIGNFLCLRIRFLFYTNQQTVR
ncbi:hypothetical protein [Hymenobacter sediminicola]|uniref:Uncharacterized protein n=1 Tax=Hymenobacter sediminicola TaxID=2761579 RepID=A0A7G7W4S8_9BACT|nr:hypothetical protein [Hymenobacter sediminicola]QNH61371.1 hypothetical protein H4317_14545 [Hymenobacter sediminicola]